MSFMTPTYRTVNGQRIDGLSALAFIHNGDYHLTSIRVYKDGMIDCWDWVDLEGFKEKVRSGWVVTQPPEGAMVSVSFLAQFQATAAHFWIKPSEFIKEVEDVIEQLNGRPTTTVRCQAAWRQYRNDSTEENRVALKLAYEAIPEHNRRYVLGDMDAKDGPVRRILYAGREESVE